MSLPPSDFAATFRAIVIPRLRPMIESHGALVAVYHETFTDARSYVMGEAFRLGAGTLPPEHLNAFIDWLDSQLLVAVDATEARSEKVGRDVSTWNVAVKAHFAEVADG